MAKQAEKAKARHSFEIEGAVAFDDSGKPAEWAKIENARVSVHPTPKQAELAAAVECDRLARGMKERMTFFRHTVVPA